MVLYFLNKFILFNVWLKANFSLFSDLWIVFDSTLECDELITGQVAYKIKSYELGFFAFFIFCFCICAIIGAIMYVLFSEEEIQENKKRKHLSLFQIKQRNYSEIKPSTKSKKYFARELTVTQKIIINVVILYFALCISPIFPQLVLTTLFILYKTIGFLLHFIFFFATC